MRYQHYINAEETSERALDNNQIRAEYTGMNKTLVGTKGETYFNKQDDKWYYRPVVNNVRGEWFRVHETNINFLS